MEDVTASLCVSVVDRITPQLISSYADWYFFILIWGLCTVMSLPMFSDARIRFLLVFLGIITTSLLLLQW